MTEYAQYAFRDGYVFPEPYRQLDFEMLPSFCGDECSYTPLKFEVTEVWGTSSKVAVGERYVVRGNYELAGEEPYAVSLGVRAAFGATACVPPGAGPFETSAEILQLHEQNPNAIGVVVAPQPANIVAWIRLKA